MNIEIRRLTPDLADDYVHFFDVTPHNEGGEQKCYCVTWRKDESYSNEPHWYPTAEERRSKALKFVRDGSIQGYLAYSDGNVIGWCNANSGCKLCIDYLSNEYPIGDRLAGEKVKSIFCFVIAPEVRRAGVATKLTERVCMDAADDGFDCVEAYVNKSHTDFRGAFEMYKKLGFISCDECGDKIVMRKALK